MTTKGSVQAKLNAVLDEKYLLEIQLEELQSSSQQKEKELVRTIHFLRQRIGFLETLSTPAPEDHGPHLEEITQLKGTISSLEAEMEDLRSMARESQAAADELRNDNETKATVVQELQRRIHKLVSLNEDYMVQLAQKEDALGNLQQTVSELKQLVAEQDEKIQFFHEVMQECKENHTILSTPKSPGQPNSLGYALLEKEVSRLAEDLAKEQSAVTLARQHLEAETILRVKLEQQVLDLQQSNRNSILEKKQEKFRSDLQQLQDEIRERDRAVSCKLVAEQTLQEKKLDDLAGQLQILESTKMRLETAMAQLRKETKQRIVQKDEEMDELRCSSQKEVRALEAQLENEREERIQLLRSKHELKLQLAAAKGKAAHAIDEDLLQKLKRDLKQTKALLRDTQSKLDLSQFGKPGKALVTRLRNQLEDAESFLTVAIKRRRRAEQELEELEEQFEDLLRSRRELEGKYLSSRRDRLNLQAQLDETQADMSEIMRKYKFVVAQLSVSRIALQEQATELAILESENTNLKQEVEVLTARLYNAEIDTQSMFARIRLELLLKETQFKLDLEQRSKMRLETEVDRLKEASEKSQQKTFHGLEKTLIKTERD